MSQNNLPAGEAHPTYLDAHGEPSNPAPTQDLIIRFQILADNYAEAKPDDRAMHAVIQRFLRLVQQAKIDIHLEYADKLEGRPRIEAMISAWELGHDREAIVPQWQIELEKSL